MSERSFRFRILAALHCSFLWVPSRRRAIRKFGHLLRFLQSIDQANSQVEDDISSLIVIPKVPHICKHLYIGSTCTHIVNILTTSALILNAEKNLTGKNSISCLFPRLVFHSSLSVNQTYATCFSLLFSVLHIVFRWIVFDKEYEFEQNLIYYLLWDEKSIQFNSSMIISPTKAILLQQVRQSILFMEVENSRAKMIPRPNRTNEARVKLIKTINKNSVQVCSIMLFLAITLLLPAFWTIFFEQELIYTDCTITPFDASYLIRSIVSCHITLVHFIECFLCILIPAAALSVFIDDLINYWLTIEVRLKKLRDILLIKRVLDDELDYIKPRRRINNGNYRSRTYLTRSSELEVENIRETNQFGQFDTEEETLELQSMLCDIFREIRNLDNIVSILLLFSLINWFAGFALMSVIGGTSVYIIRGFQINAVFTICVMSKICLNIIDKTRPAYNLISSLVALDSSLNKGRWLVISSNYIRKPSYGFTIALHGVFTRLTVLKIFAYTFSFSFVMETLIGKSFISS